MTRDEKSRSRVFKYVIQILFLSWIFIILFSKETNGVKSLTQSMMTAAAPKGLSWGQCFKKPFPWKNILLSMAELCTYTYICVRECLKRWKTCTAINIISDSKVVLLAFRLTNVRSGLIDKCLMLLNAQGHRNKLTLGWIPWHERLKVIKALIVSQRKEPNVLS